MVVPSSPKTASFLISPLDVEFKVDYLKVAALVWPDDQPRPRKEPSMYATYRLYSWLRGSCGLIEG